jgi:hypothetical protein
MAEGVVHVWETPQLIEDVIGLGSAEGKVGMHWINGDCWYCVSL